MEALWQKFPNIRKSLKAKLLLIYILVLVLPVGLLDAFFFYVTLHSSRANAMDILRDNQQTIAQSISNKADATEKIAEILALDANIRTVFGLHYDSPARRLVDYQMLTAGSVSNMLKFSTDVNAIYLYNDDLLICEMADSFFSVQKDKSGALFEQMNVRPLEGASRWVLARKGPYNAVRPETSPLRSIGYQRIVTSHAGIKCAVIEVIVDKDVLLAPMYEQSTFAGSYTLIADSDGRVVFSTADNAGVPVKALGFPDFAPGTQMERFTKDAVQIVLPIENLGVSLITSVPLGSLYSGMYASALGVVLLSLISMLLCSSLYAFLVQRQLSAISPMMQAMRQIRGGNFTTRVPSASQDELGALARDFNYMSEKLQEMIDRVYVAGQMEREAELHALEANINPHFLYNSLATITWMARFKGCAEIVEISDALARLYRAVLSDGRSVITFAEEMEMVRAYLKVQGIRFEDKFSAHLEVSPEALDFPILKNIVQPLVENALEHGIGPKLEKGRLCVHARVDGDRLDLCVVDDGVGMTEARRGEVARGLPGKGRHGYAIRNILQRLNVFYEERYTFVLHSAPNRGTTVHLVLPRPKTIWQGGERDGQNAGG